jgi:anti-anti-sigma factor
VDLQPLACAFDENTRTLFLSGSVDELSGPALRDRIVEHSGDYREDLVVDLVAVDFLPSLGVGVLAVAQRDCEANGATLELVVRHDTVPQQVLRVCGLPYRER